MCSTLEARLAMLRAAIDEVALAARADRSGLTGPGELAERLAALWGMIAALDPALAARLPGYGPAAGWDTPLCRNPGRAPSLPRVLVRDHADRSRGRGAEPRATAKPTEGHEHAWPQQHNRKLSNRPQPPIAGPGGSAPGQTPRVTAKAAGGR